jgi:hypothetical protein
MRDDSLWDDNTHGVDDLAGVPVGRRASTDTAGRHIGCPVWWLKAVLPVVYGKNELAVALFLYRLRVIHNNRTVPVTNVRLLAELGIDRRVKYRTIKRLEGAGLITVQRRGKNALKITFPRRRQSLRRV